MDRIKALFSGLSRSEIKALKTYLMAFHLKGENKQLELLRLVEKKPEITAEAASKKLYGDPKSKAFIMMKARLYEKMTEFLPLSVNPESQKYSRDIPYFRDLIDYRKSMLTATVLQDKRLGALAQGFFERSLKLAHACNNPELEVDVLLRLRAMKRGSGDVFDELTGEIGRALSRQVRDINAIGIYHKLLELHTLKSARDQDKIDFLEQHLPELEEQLRQDYSPRADYYLQMLRTAYFSLVGDYEQCKATIGQALKVIDENVGIRSRQRMSDPWFQLAMLELKFHDHEAAILAFEKAIENLKPKSRAFIMASIMSLYAYIYKGEIEATEQKAEALKALIEKGGLRNFTMVRGLFTYLLTCIAYKKGELRKAWRLIGETQELNFDKEGWITGLRIFELIILLDLEEYDLVEMKLENLRKHLSRYPGEERAKTIHRLLVAQEKKAFAFEAFAEEEKLLEALENEHPWKQLGHEVIRFDHWYREKRGLVKTSTV